MWSLHDHFALEATVVTVLRLQHNRLVELLVSLYLCRLFVVWKLISHFFYRSGQKCSVLIQLKHIANKKQNKKKTVTSTTLHDIKHMHRRMTTILFLKLGYSSRLTFSVSRPSCVLLEKELVFVLPSCYCTVLQPPVNWLFYVCLKVGVTASSHQLDFLRWWVARPSSSRLLFK